MASQGSHAVLNLLGNLTHGMAGLDGLLSPLANLAMDFGRLTIVVEEFIVHVVDKGEMTDFLSCGAKCVILAISVWHDFALGVDAGWVQDRESHSGWSGLANRRCCFALFLLLCFVFAFLLLA